MRIGFVGANNLTKHYYNSLVSLGNTREASFIDSSLINARAFIKQYNIKYCENEQDFLKQVDAVILCAFYKNTDELVNKAIRMGKHLLIANPFLVSQQTLKQLKNLSTEAGITIQNAWSEKYNSAFLTASSYINNAVFVDVARLSQYSPSNAKISVVNDLLHKDIEWVLSVVKSNLRKVSANALSVVNTEPDFINAKLEFDNGCIVNLTASRVSEMNLRKARIYNDKSVLFIDFLAKQLKRSYKKSSFLEFEDVDVNTVDEAENQLNDFFRSIKEKKEPESNLNHILEARDVTTIILEKIMAKTNLFVA
ncbi:MAG TPA: Gfo/Idh/MocA family oxidoreductase [Bacteroidia bacterium]